MRRRKIYFALGAFTEGKDSRLLSKKRLVHLSYGRTVLFIEAEPVQVQLIIALLSRTETGSWYTTQQ